MGLMEKPVKKRFLLVGETGVGKTTALNQICGSTYETSDMAIGVTFRYQAATFWHREPGADRDSLYEMIDTVGLSEGEGGRVHAAVAFAKLVQFVKRAENGFNGIFLVTGTPRVTNKMQDNYRLFVEVVTGKKVPCFLFINKQEFEEYETQYDRNDSTYKSQGFDFADGFAGGFKMPSTRDWTVRRFHECLDQTPEEPKRLYTEGTLTSYLGKLWRSIIQLYAKLFGLTKEEFEDPFKEDVTIENILKKLGVPDRLIPSVSQNFQTLSDSDIDALAEKLKGLNENP